MQIQNVKLNKIKLSKNSRMNVSQEELAGLMQSIKESGLLEPIGLTKNGKGYVVTYGHRRFLAMSKLGKATVPAIIHDEKDQKDIDIMNLAENVQRRNISIIEVGRYITLLKEQGMSNREVAIRLGVTNTYIDSALTAFNRVPKKLQKNIVQSNNGRPHKPGQISMTTIQKISTAAKKYGLNVAKERKLYELATKPEFSSFNIEQYARALANNKKNPINNVVRTKKININIMVSEIEFERLQRKYISDGPFPGMGALFESILKGETSERVKIR